MIKRDLCYLLHLLLFAVWTFTNPAMSSSIKKILGQQKGHCLYSEGSCFHPYTISRSVSEIEMCH